MSGEEGHPVIGTCAPCLAVDPPLGHADEALDQIIRNRIELWRDSPHIIWGDRHASRLLGGLVAVIAVGAVLVRPDAAATSSAPTRLLNLDCSRRDVMLRDRVVLHRSPCLGVNFVHTGLEAHLLAAKVEISRKDRKSTRLNSSHVK